MLTTFTREAFRFHFEHGGYIVGERAICAARAARAEKELHDGIDAGTLRAVWSYDDDADTSYLDNEPESFRDRVTHYVLRIDRLDTWRNVVTGEERREWTPISALYGIGMLPESEAADRRMFEAEVYSNRSEE